MKNVAISLVSIVVFLSAGAVVSQQVTQPEMNLQNINDDVREMDDGRKVGRISASTVGLIRVEWPEGTSTTPHNHANELVLSVVSGRLRAISGDQEIIMEAGDTVIIPAWVEHSYVALEDSITYEAAGPG
ncbi:MAG: cupin domain-containing protein [Gammaproteobacteria bacterium]